MNCVGFFVTIKGLFYVLRNFHYKSFLCRCIFCFVLDNESSRKDGERVEKKEANGWHLKF